MKSIKIFGLPVPVSERGHRIVLDERIRTLYGISINDSVLVERTATGLIQILPANAKPMENRVYKSISEGRFNLPKEWTEENNIKTGTFVYLIMADTGILICPASVNFMIQPDVVSWNFMDIR